jgi:hypothetical protein
VNIVWLEDSDGVPILPKIHYIYNLKINTMIFSENFREALADYTFLLNKVYPHKTILELVATRYSLNHFERSMLFRGISTEAAAALRKSKLITIEQWSSGTMEQWTNKPLHIDLFNALFAIAAYLRGYPVYLSNDGLLRDASESHGSGEWEEHLDKGLDLLLNSLGSLKISKAIIYIDNPLEYGFKITEKLLETAKLSKPKIEIITHPSPDHLLIEAKEGILATSDSTIIDKSALPVFDLPRAVLEFHFEPKFLRLE